MKKSFFFAFLLAIISFLLDLLPYLGIHAFILLGGYLIPYAFFTEPLLSYSVYVYGGRGVKMFFAVLLLFVLGFTLDYIMWISVLGIQVDLLFVVFFGALMLLQFLLLVWIDRIWIDRRGLL